MSALDPDWVPSTIEEAAKHLFGRIPLSEVDEMRKVVPKKIVIRHPCGTETEHELIPNNHFGLGMYVRNTWSLWEDTPLRRHAMEHYGIKHGDDLWGMINEWVWALVQGKTFDHEAYSKRIAGRWSRVGLNSFGESP